MLPPGHPDIADALYEMGWLTGGREQERLYEQALAIMPDTGLLAERRIAVLQGLTTNLRRQGRLAEAVTADREALRIAEQAFGPEHPTTGYAMIHLGDQMHDVEQDVEAAERLYRRGLDVMARHFGDSSVRLIHGLNSLATLLGNRGDDEAEQHLRRALAIRQSATGAEHPQVADQLHRLARELNRQGRTREAEALARDALDLTIRMLGPDHPVLTSERLPLLAEIFERQGRHAAADSTYRKAIAEIPLSGVVPGELCRRYGRLLLARGDHAQAEEQLLKSLELLETAYRGATHPNVQETRRALMELYQRWGRPELVERHRLPPGRYVPY